MSTKFFIIYYNKSQYQNIYDYFHNFFRNPQLLQKKYSKFTSYCVVDKNYLQAVVIVDNPAKTLPARCFFVIIERQHVYKPIFILVLSTVCG